MEEQLRLDDNEAQTQTTDGIIVAGDDAEIIGTDDASPDTTDDEAEPVADGGDIIIADDDGVIMTDGGRERPSLDDLPEQIGPWKLHTDEGAPSIGDYDEATDTWEIEFWYKADADNGKTYSLYAMSLGDGYSLSHQQLGDDGYLIGSMEGIESWDDLIDSLHDWADDLSDDPSALS